MFAYMTKIRTVEMSMVREVIVEETDLQRLLYSFLEELLVVFATDGLIARGVIVDEFDLGHMRLRARMVGELWDPSKHPQGTEIKAITFSNMQLWSPDTTPLPEDHEELHSKPEDPAHIYVIVDI